MAKADVAIELRSLLPRNGEPTTVQAGNPGNERADALARQGIPGGEPDEAAPGH